jgi:hypothetical protein
MEVGQGPNWGCSAKERKKERKKRKKNIIFSSYLAGNTLHLRCRDQPVLGYSHYLLYHTKYTNTLCVQNAEFYCVMAGGIYTKALCFKGFKLR